MSNKEQNQDDKKPEENKAAEQKEEGVIAGSVADEGSEDGQLNSLFVDKEDKQRLEKMSELEREMIIAQRAEEQDNKQLLQKKSSNKKGPNVRASSRLSAQRNRSNAMSELRQKKAARTRRKEDLSEEEYQDDEASYEEEMNDASTFRSENEDDFIDDDEVEEVDQEESYKKKSRGLKRSREDNDRGRSTRRRRHIQDDIGMTGFVGATYNDIKGIQITRDIVEQWVNEPYFEETMPDCIVKLADGEKQEPHRRFPSPHYLVAQVVQIIDNEGQSYKFGAVMRIKTCKQVIVKDGNDERWFQLSMISNKPVTKQEFDHWSAKLEGAGEDPMTRSMVEQVKAKIHKARTYTYTAQDVKQIVEQKRKKGLVTLNPVMEKVRLTRLLNYHKENDHTEEVERLESEIAVIEERILQEEKQKKPSAYDKINKRNKEASMKRAQQRPMKQTSTQALASRKSKTLKLSYEEIQKRRLNFDPVKVLKDIGWKVDVSALDSENSRMTMGKKLLGTKFVLTEDKLSIPLNKDRNIVLTISNYKKKQGLN